MELFSNLMEKSMVFICVMHASDCAYAIMLAMMGKVHRTNIQVRIIRVINKYIEKHTNTLTINVNYLVFSLVLSLSLQAKLTRRFLAVKLFVSPLTN